MVGAAAGPAIVKPNATELLAAVGRTALGAGTGDRAAVLAAADAAMELRDRGADAVVVTLGADGLLAVTAEGTWQAGSTPISGNATGAGDAVAAGLARGLVFGYSWATLLSHAVALGAAAVAAPVAGQFTEADYDRALAEVEISSWEASECP
jgi:tagatose 6-phosphate kinase